MIRNALCPVLVRRDEQLAILEEALLAARRGEGRFVVLAGEAGIGKTRLAGELAREARQLGCAVLVGGCSEAEISLPYLPFIEAIGNFIDAAELDELTARLGPSGGPLAQLFPQFPSHDSHGGGGDPAQEKLRLFEAVAALLNVVAEDGGLLLIIEDVHWSDASTRELLDHLARRLVDVPAMVLVTYRSDELHRRHPFVPTVQAWRRSGLAEIVELEPLTAAGIAEMIAAILGADEVDAELGELMHGRTEGNPFVLEEMLREAPETIGASGDWRREALDDMGIPESVRDTILLRLTRLDPQHVAILEAGAVLGRAFDYQTLLAVSQADEAEVHSALEVAVAQGLIEEDGARPGRFRWRHALTQEAIYTDTVTPRRQAIHGRAADVLAGDPASKAVDLAHHLLGAGRFADAVPVCLRAAEEAERALAFGEATTMLERALPHLDDDTERARVVCRIGKDHWLNGKSSTAERFLSEGIESLTRLGEQLEAARYRVVLGRCLWEGAKPDLARAEYVRARDLLAQEGPSADLAMAYIRLAGLDAFELDYEGCLEHSRSAVAIAEQSGADLERVWALGFEGLGLLDSGDYQQGFDVMDRCYAEASEKGYWLIAQNVTWNDLWTRTHTLQGGLEERLERFATLRSEPFSASSYVRRARGELEAARDAAEKGIALFERLGQSKMRWRCEVHLAEVLVELGQAEAADAVLPPPSTRTELQDLVYDAAPRIRIPLARGDLGRALGFAREIVAEVDRLVTYTETLAIAAEALVAAGELEEAERLAEKVAAHQAGAAASYLDEIRGRVLIARGNPVAARPLLSSAVEAAARVRHRLVELRRRVLMAEAVGAAGDLDGAQRELGSLVEDADRCGARLIRAEAEAAAGRLGLALPEAAQDGPEPRPAPQPALLGERLVTSLFADVRGYSELSAKIPPAELADRMAALYRYARTAVDRRGGIVDKFAGDAVMATFNVSGTRVDHCVSALEAALSLRDKAALLDLPLGIGIAVGPAVLARGASEANIAVRGISTNLAARLQDAAGENDVLLSDEAYVRVKAWLEGHGLRAERKELELKGFAEPQIAHRVQVD